MWQHHYLIHAMRMNELRAEAERELRWRLADEERAVDPPARPARDASGGAAARFAAAVARSADRVARRLDQRITVDLGSERVMRDA